MTRRGHIDESGDIKSLDLIEFNGGVNPYGNDFVSSGFKPGSRRFREIITEWRFDNLGAVADVGSGFGRWSVFLAEVNEEVVGIERNSGANALAAKICAYFGLDNARFETCDSGELPIEANTFDGIWCNNAMQFFHRGKTMQEIHRVLMPGGKLFLGQYNSIARVLEKFIEGYRKGGLGNAVTRRMIDALKGGPHFDEPGNYAVPDQIPQVLSRFGFTLVEDPPVEYQMKGGLRYDGENVSENLKDIPALAARLETDKAFAAQFVENPSEIYAYPINVQFLAVKN